MGSAVLQGPMALAPMEPDCVTLAPTSKEIIKTWGNCVTLCRAITKVKVQTSRVGKRWLWVSQEFKRKSTETEKLKERKQNGDSVKSIICCRENGSLTRRKPLGVLLEVVNILMLSQVAHSNSAVFCSHLLINNYCVLYMSYLQNTSVRAQGVWI